ncbi:hypothetical protein ACLB2K_039393 [Fragaria x ananassa]
MEQQGVEKMKQKVMVAIDESELSHYALEWTLENLGNTIQNSELLVFTAQPITIDFAPELVAALQENYKKVALGLLDKAKNICANYGIVARTVTEIGDPKKAICEAVEKFNIELLVLGSHGRGLVQRTFLGSVSNYCIHNARCTVLVITMGEVVDNGGAAESGEKPVMVAVDESECSHYALMWVIDNLKESINTNSPLHIFMAQPPPANNITFAASLGAARMYCPPNPEFTNNMQENHTKLTTALLERAKDICASHGALLNQDMVTAKTVTDIGDAKTAICAAVLKHNVKLLVLGELLGYAP